MLKNKNNAFTLIELLAVIIILAVIALIATPIVLNVVDSARKSAFESSAYGIVDAVRLKSIENRLNNVSIVKEYTFPTDEIEVQGAQPKGGTIKVDSEGRIAVSIYNEKWCATKEYTDNVLTIADYTEENCVVDTEEQESYVAGDLLKIEVGENIFHNFYVLEDNGDSVTVILDRNLGDNVAWRNNGDTTPTIANTQLNTLTTDWINITSKRIPSALDILKHTTWYQELEDKENWKSEYIEYGSSFSLPDCSSNEECRTKFTEAGYGDVLVPKWLDINLYTSGDDTTDSNGNYRAGYWLSELFSTNPDNAFSVYVYGLLFCSDVSDSSSVSVRPVITINKSHIIEKLTGPIYVND